MGKKSASSANKSKEKRQARKLEQHRIADGMSFVTSANKQDLASICKEMLVYKNKDLEVNMYVQKVLELNKEVADWAIDLTERNMKKLYETCAWGWNKDRKVAEMTDDAAWYLVAEDKESGLPVGFSHFRFDMDFGEPVLYCYEVQLENSGRRQGLGQHMLSVLERVASATMMRFVRLTVLTHNPAAAAFFKACGYTLDETSPPKDEAAHYEILSKSVV